MEPAFLLFISGDIDNYNWQAEEEGYKYLISCHREEELWGWGGRWHPTPLTGAMEEDGASQPLSTSQHLFLIVGDDFHRIMEIRDKKACQVSQHRSLPVWEDAP